MDNFVQMLTSLTSYFRIENTFPPYLCTVQVQSTDLSQIPISIILYRVNHDTVQYFFLQKSPRKEHQRAQQQHVLTMKQQHLTMNIFIISDTLGL
jgi:hypothetical protein